MERCIVCGEWLDSDGDVCEECFDSAEYNSIESRGYETDAAGHCFSDADSGL